MSQRFQIEDLVAQDSLGVVFRALDTETNSLVAVRRFFPFGADGGGLNRDEDIAYGIAVSRLAGLNHPSMRAVVFGGCDPIDGMPFIATEWVEGKSLNFFLKSKQLTPAHAISLIKSALEICELLSELLAEQGVWVETDTQTIIVGTADSGRGVTFWISPLKWLGHHGEPHSLDAIVALTEEIMGWQGQAVSDQAGRGLGGWLKWLRNSSKTATLSEAREMLVASTGIEPPTPSKNFVRSSTAGPAVPMQTIKSPRKKSVNGTAVTIVLLVLIAGGLGAWAFFRKDPNDPKFRGGLAELAAEVSRESAKTNASSPNAPSPDGLSEEMREVAAAMKEAPAQPEEKKKPEPIAKSAPGVYSPDDSQITQQEGREVIVEGVFENIGYSKTGKTLYILFSKTSSKNATRGAILTSNKSSDLSEKALTALLGKKIQLRGILNVQTYSGLNRPEVNLKDRAAIKVITR